MKLSIVSFKRLPRDERRLVVKKHAMAFAYSTYRENHPGCDLDEAFAAAERTWSRFEEMALDFLAISFAQSEERVMSN